MPPKHPADTALSIRPPKKRTFVRFFALAVSAMATFALVPADSVAAVPVSDRTATWIATTARQVALELRDARELPDAESRFVAERQIDELAGLISYLLDADVNELRSAWTNAPLQRKIALFSALSQVGVPYKLNADAPFIALDCSALTRFAWAQAGVSIERGSAQQYERGNRVSRDTARVGDLIWYPGHIMMSLGVPGLIVHARSGERAIEVHRIDSSRMSWMRWVSPID